VDYDPRQVDAATAEVGAGSGELLLSPPSSPRLIISPDHGRLIQDTGPTSTMSNSVPSEDPAPPKEAATIHPIIRNALRISLSVKEYRALHDVAVKRSPTLKDKLPSPSHYEKMANPKSRHTETALRTALRVFVGSGIGLKLVEVVTRRVRGDATL